MIIRINYHLLSNKYTVFPRQISGKVSDWVGIGLNGVAKKYKGV